MTQQLSLCYMLLVELPLDFDIAFYILDLQEYRVLTENRIRLKFTLWGVKVADKTKTTHKSHKQ